MRKTIRRLAAAGAISLLSVIGPAVSASAAPVSQSLNEVKGFILLRDFPKGESVRGGMGTTREICSRGNNGRPLDIRGDESLDVTVTHSDALACRKIGVSSVWQLNLVSPDRFTGSVGFVLEEKDNTPILVCKSPSTGHLHCQNTDSSGGHPRIIVFRT